MRYDKDCDWYIERTQLSAYRCSLYIDVAKLHFSSYYHFLMIAQDLAIRCDRSASQGVLRPFFSFNNGGNFPYKRRLKPGCPLGHFKFSANSSLRQRCDCFITKDTKYNNDTPDSQWRNRRKHWRIRLEVDGTLDSTVYDDGVWNTIMERCSSLVIEPPYLEHSWIFRIDSEQQYCNTLNEDQMFDDLSDPRRRPNYQHRCYHTFCVGHHPEDEWFLSLRRLDRGSNSTVCQIQLSGLRVIEHQSSLPSGLLC